MPKNEFWDPVKRGFGEFVGDMFGPMGIGPRQHDMKDRMFPARDAARRRQKPKIRDAQKRTRRY
ncbi:unnamed protein product [marine sediment metagenome]|uniref:Uncharacterized protein n=1 Tax=marine sediment metagenome TaxID=412755 RepID=X0WHS8_9ZZZZ